MKQDEKAIKEVIHKLKKHLPVGNYDRALYATYIYCLRSRAHGVLHMKIWNKLHPYQLQLGTTANPRYGKMEFNTLEDQDKFIDHVRAYIERQAKSKWGDWDKLRLDFDAIEESSHDDCGTATASVAVTTE